MCGVAPKVDTPSSGYEVEYISTGNIIINKYTAEEIGW